ncbi:MAG: flagellar protein FlaG [Betaproteobacteria bacterium]|nr:flagellar protein FlaG [Betaproteobacteria bacterium]
MDIQQISGQAYADFAPNGSSATPVPQAAAGPASAEGVQASAQSAQSAATQGKPDPQAIQQSVAQINQAVESYSLNFQFSVDKTTGISVVKVIDPQTKQVIRQIPPEQTIEIAKSLDQLKGLLLQHKA